MNFKVLEWLRRVRDETYVETKQMSPKEKIEYTKKMAKEFSKKKQMKIGSNLTVVFAAIFESLSNL
ncbi:MAG: hypothetical protein IIA61_10465 [Candidatus Marinimicrobia bacterium]|nr:hypothetical protein [Candidatus Neomarinimicrobiota bacterium]